MKVQHRIVAATALSLALVVNGASTTAFAGGAKPARLVIGAGASALYWSNPMPLGTGTRYGTVKITSGVVIARVRQLINAIPVSDYGANQICPMDVMVPVVIRFSRSTAVAAFAAVVFQLGGCPTATVYQHGVAQHPTLGGWALAKQYAAIEKLILDRGTPLA